MIFFLQTIVLRCKFDLVVKRSKVILGSSSGQMRDFESLMLYTKIQPQSFLELGEDHLIVFYHIRAWRPSILMVEPYEQIVNIHPTEDPM